MRQPLAESADANNKYEDLSGVDLSGAENPYEALIRACNDNPLEMQDRYVRHRSTRNTQQREKMLSPAFEGLNVDRILKKLDDPSIEPGYVDPRHCMVFWARPPQHIKDLVDQIQQKLKRVSPDLWLMPIANLHLTALEITHSLTADELEPIVDSMKPVIPSMVNYMLAHRSRLIKPFLSYDASAIALSFVPAAGEALPGGRSASDDAYTYHHLRRDLFDLATKPPPAGAGVTIESRYVVPSAHITIGRFLERNDHDTLDKMQTWLDMIDWINSWLVETYWPKEGQSCEIAEGGEWLVGQGKGLDCRIGTLWYGGGETVMLGHGF